MGAESKNRERHKKETALNLKDCMFHPKTCRTPLLVSCFTMTATINFVAGGGRREGGGGGGGR